MKTVSRALALTVVFSLPLFGQTFGDKLGKEQIKEVVKEVIDTFVEDFEGRAEPLTMQLSTVVISLDFPDAVTEIISELHTSLDEEAATARIRSGFRVFLERFAEYLREQSTGGVLHMNKKNLHKYIAYAKAANRCGEIPCSQPPCCDNCDPCSDGQNVNYKYPLPQASVVSCYSPGTGALLR